MPTSCQHVFPILKWSLQSLSSTLGGIVNTCGSGGSSGDLGHRGVGRGFQRDVDRPLEELALVEHRTGPWPGTGSILPAVPHGTTVQMSPIRAAVPTDDEQ